jgi:hypothetical protein
VTREKSLRVCRWGTTFDGQITDGPSPVKGPIHDRSGRCLEFIRRVHGYKRVFCVGKTVEGMELYNGMHGNGLRFLLMRAFASTDPSRSRSDGGDAIVRHRKTVVVLRTKRGGVRAALCGVMTKSILPSSRGSRSQSVDESSAIRRRAMSTTKMTARMIQSLVASAARGRRSP